MAVAYKSAGSGVATEASGGNLQPACPATVDANDILIAHVAYEGTTTTPSTPSGWTLLGGPYTIQSAHRHWIFGKIAAGTEDGSAISFGTPAVTTVRTGRIYSFSGYTSGTITDVVPSASFSHQSHATDPQMPTVTTTYNGSLAIAAVWQADDNAQASATGESGGDWTEAVAEYIQSATTPDTGMGLQTCTPTGNPGTVSGGSIATTDDPCGVIGFEIRPLPSFSQDAFRFYEDGTESGSTAINTQGTDITRDVNSNSNLQLRLRIQNGTANATLSTDDYQLKYSLSGGGYTDVGSVPIGESQTTNDSSSTVNGVGSPPDASAQAFTPTVSHSIPQVIMKLQKNNSPTDNIFVELRSSAPDGTLIATSDNVDGSTLTTDTAGAEVTFTFSSPPSVTASTQYFLVFKRAGAGDASNFYKVHYIASNAYGGGNMWDVVGGAWTEFTTRDWYFKEFLGTISAVNGYNSASLTDGNATTNRLTGGTGSFVAGEISEDGLVDNLQITASNFTELLYSLTLVSSALADNDTLDFEVTNSNGVALTYNDIPRITVDKGAAAYTLTAAAGSYVETGTAASLEYNREVAGDSGSYAVTGTAASLEYNYKVAAGIGSYAITGAAASLEYNRLAFVVDSGSYSISGTTAGLNRSYPLGAGSGSFTISGTGASLEHDQEVLGGSGQFLITGTSASLEYARIMPVDAGSYTISGTAASLFKSFPLAAGSGTYTVSGTAASLIYNHKLSAASVSYSITGTTASLEYNRIFQSDSGSYLITGTATTLYRNFPFSAGSSSYTVSGTTASLEHGQEVFGESGVYIITGTVASLKKTTTFVVEPGSYTLNGTATSLEYARIMSVNFGSYLITGSAATLTYDQDTTYTLVVDSGSFAITGMIASLEHNQEVLGESGQFIITGTAANLEISLVPPEPPMAPYGGYATASSSTESKPENFNLLGVG